MKYHGRWMVWVLVMAVVLLPACESSSEAAEKVEPAHVEPIEGTGLSRVVLTERAVERLDIRTVPVRDEQVTRKRDLGGQVVDVEVSILVRVPLTESDLSAVDRSLPVVLRSLDASGDSCTASIVDAPDPADAASALYCLVDDTGCDFALDQRLFAEVSLTGVEAERKVIPYAAILYDLNGDTWVYTQVEPRVFVRAPISVDYIEGDVAVLSEGPPDATEVVTNGASELFGTETGIGGH